MSELSMNDTFEGMRAKIVEQRQQTMNANAGNAMGNAILQAIAALADGVTRRDRQLHLMAEQLGRIEQAADRGGVKGQETRESLHAISRQLAANQQKTMELFVAIDVRLKAMEEKLSQISSPDWSKWNNAPLVYKATSKPRKQKRVKR